MSGLESTAVAERWLEVPGFPGYRVSDRGRVQSRRHRNGMPAGRWRLLHPGANGRGYPHVRLAGPGGRARNVEVHRLVWEAFNGPIPAGAVIRHAIDPDPWNCRLSNLACGTRADNCRDKDAHGTAQRGEARPRAKLTCIQVIDARRKVRALIVELADSWAVSEQAVRDVVVGRTWREVTADE